MSTNHLSTFPFFSPSFGLIFLMKSTLSFSGLTIPVTSSLSSKINWFIASKHLLTWRWIKVTSLAYANISNNWSSDKKKKRGKYFLLVSKYYERLFWTASNVLLLWSNSYLYLSESIPSHNAGSLLNYSITIFQFLSMLSNLPFSVGLIININKITISFWYHLMQI